MGKTFDSAFAQLRRTEQSVWVPEIGEHWDRTYASRPDVELSWFEREPTMSVRWISEAARAASDAVIDIGGGTSELVDRLLQQGFTDVTVLDIAAHALDRVRGRLGPDAPRVHFVCHDVLTWSPERTYDVWHDRAVFHFLTDANDRADYVALAARTVKRGGAVVLATFAQDGPTHCSGLPVTRYSPATAAATFGEAFRPVASEREEHVTPAGVVQPFNWVVLRRVSAATG